MDLYSTTRGLSWEGARAAGKPIGILGFGTDLARNYFARGFDFVAVAGDSWLLARQMDAMIAGLRD